MANHFFAIDPQGKAHTRTSKDRTYTHTVLSYIPAATEADLVKAVERRVACYGSYWSYEAAMAQPGHYEAKYGARHPELAERARVEAAAFLAQYPTNEAYMAHLGAVALADFDKSVANGEFDVWVSQGWCGRPDLALKLAVNGGQVFEAQVGKPPKA